MGFNKRFINQDTLIQTYKNKGSLENLLLTQDALIFEDKKSYNFFQKFAKKGLTHKLKKKLDKWSQKTP